MTDELDPCPFCGGEARLSQGHWYEGSWVWPTIYCLDRKCGASKQAVEHPWSEDEAIAAWNIRV